MSADTGSDPDPVATSEQINLVARLPLHLHPPRGGPRSVMVRERDLTKPCDDDEPALLCVSIIPGSEGGGFPLSFTFETPTRSSVREKERKGKKTRKQIELLTHSRTPDSIFMPRFIVAADFPPFCLPLERRFICSFIITKISITVLFPRARVSVNREDRSLCSVRVRCYVSGFHKHF